MVESTPIDPFKDAIVKDVSVSLQFIRDVESEASYLIESKEPSIHGSSAKTYRENGAFILSFTTTKFLDMYERNDLWKSDASFTCRNDRLALSFDFKSFSKWSIPTMVDPRRFDCSIRNYHTSRIDHGDHFFRAIIPTKEPQAPGSLFESSMVKIGNVIHSAGLVKIRFSNQDFHLFPYTTDDKKANYLFVESVTQVNYHKFKRMIDAILLSYAFVTGYFPRDQRYVIGARDELFSQISHIAFETLPSSFSSKYSVIPTSAIRIGFRISNEIEFPQAVFNDLCERINSHSALARVILVLVEGHVLSIELRAAVYSIALEAITSIISEENETQFIPIPKKPFARRILRALSASLQEYKADLTPAALETLSKKLSVLNTPTNKDKLLKPFSLYQISLTPDEIDSIERRNDFLHGRFPFDPDNTEQRFELEQTVLTLLYCVTALLLKYIGYSGFVIYYPALNEHKRGHRLTNYFVKRI